MMTNLPALVNHRVLDILKMGGIYISGRDRFYRPIVVIRPKLMFDMNPVCTVEELIACQAAIFGYVEQFMMKPGQIENIVFVNDQRDLGVFSINYTLLKAIISYVTGVFRGRVRTFFVMNAPTTFSVLWNAVSYFFDEASARKI